MVKEMKKVKKILGGIGILFIVAMVVGLMNSGEPTPKSTPTTTEDSVLADTSKEDAEAHYESEIMEDVEKTVATTDSDMLDAVPVGSKDYDKYLHLGETYVNGDRDITIEVIDIDYNTIGGKIADGYGYASTSVYIAVEITNNSDDDIYLDQNNAILFIDDYEVPKESSILLAQQNGYCIVNNTKQYPTVANIRSGGRKGTIVFVTMMTDKNGITETSEIDFEICGLTFKINPRFIHNQLAEMNRINLSDDPFIGTEYEGKTAIEERDGTYSSTDGSIIITINGNKFSVQRSGEIIIYEALFGPKDSSIPNYYVLSGTGFTVTFFDGGLLVEGLTIDGESFDDRGLDGWYSSDSSTNTESEVTTSSSDGIGTSIVYGIYSCSPNTIGGENIAYVEFETDENGGDFIMIDSYTADDEGMPNNFGGDIVENGNSYSVTGASGETLSITFVDGGMNVEVLSGDSIEEFAGYYKLDEALDLNSVG